MAIHACQIGPTDTAPPCPGSPLRSCVGIKGGTLWGKQPFCPHFSSATLVCGRCDYTLPSFSDRSGSQTKVVNWLVDVSVDQNGSSSASVAGLLMAKTGGMARSGIGCWVAAAMGRPCHSHAIFILRHIVRKSNKTIQK